MSYGLSGRVQYEYLVFNLSLCESPFSAKSASSWEARAITDVYDTAMLRLRCPLIQASSCGRRWSMELFLPLASPRLEREETTSR